MAAIHTAVNRTTIDGLPEGGWNDGERVTVKRAINAFTSVPAYASFDEQRKGLLKKGMLADLVVSTPATLREQDERCGTTIAHDLRRKNRLPPQRDIHELTPAGRHAT